MQNAVNEIEVVENSNPENQDAIRPILEVGNFRDALSRQVETGEFNQFFALIEQRSQARENRFQENLHRQELLIQASEVLYPRNRFLRNYIDSPSILLMNNLSKTVLCYLALTAEVIGGIAGYCYIKYPENAMNGTNIAEANITETNILRSEMDSRNNCMEEKIPIAMFAIPSVLLLGLVSTKIIDSFKSRRSGGEAREGAPQNDITNRVNQQANTTHLVADIVMAPTTNPNQI
jgi:hypothetical protein